MIWSVALRLGWLNRFGASLAAFCLPVSAAFLIRRSAAPATAAGFLRQTAGPCRLLVTLADLHAYFAARAHLPEDIHARSTVVSDASIRDPHAVTIGAA